MSEAAQLALGNNFLNRFPHTPGIDHLLRPSFRVLRSRLLQSLLFTLLLPSILSISSLSSSPSYRCLALASNRCAVTRAWRRPLGRSAGRILELIEHVLAVAGTNRASRQCRNCWSALPSLCSRDHLPGADKCMVIVLDAHNAQPIALSGRRIHRHPPCMPPPSVSSCLSPISPISLSSPPPSHRHVEVFHVTDRH